MRTISELEADLQQSEKTLSDLTTNFNALKKSQIELTELKHVLSFADQFLKVCLFITRYLLTYSIQVFETSTYSLDHRIRN